MEGMMSSCLRTQRKRSTKKKNHLWAEHLQKGIKIPTTPSSIPTKHQTVFIAESEKKGFNSRSLRFSYNLNQNENPGPGSYNISNGPDINNVSLSAKGTGGFPSKASINCCLPKNNVSAQAAFVSRTKREAVQLNPLKVPSPCHYTVNDSLTKESPKVLVSCFKSKTTRDILNVALNNPGPASYDPFGCPEIGKKTIFPRKHYLCFSAPAVPVPKTTNVPGPGYYELVDYEGPPKQYISSSAFVSNTSRWAGDASGADVPGPGSYNPDHLGKQSFLFNNNQKWIPA
ncbi:O(6)-methylguanine-induced apoptosis 2 isoform X2 [Aquarana catesbeiana]|uniref:O(6)-methylguanine-induced apoptosis 2 isoform X2 n=1 Tax=Aquarana catesbeiana TaxID=8400 RepID=UPI003CCA23BB